MLSKTGRESILLNPSILAQRLHNRERHLCIISIRPWWFIQYMVGETLLIQFWMKKKALAKGERNPPRVTWYIVSEPGLRAASVPVPR